MPDLRTTSDDRLSNIKTLPKKPAGPDPVRLLKFYRSFPWKGKTYDLQKIIGIDGAKLTVVVSAIDPGEKVGGPLYHRIRRLLNNLVALDLMKMTPGWFYGDILERPGNGVQPGSKLITLIDRMQNSNHFAGPVPDGLRALVDRAITEESRNAKTDPCQICTRDFWRRDAEEVRKHTQPARCRICQIKDRRIPDPCLKCSRDPGRRDFIAMDRSRWCKSCAVGIVRTWKRSPCATCAFWPNKGCRTDKTVCAYRLSVVSRKGRKDAAWGMRAIDGREGSHHWMFVRKGRKYDSAGNCIDQGEIQPALMQRLQIVQAKFDDYVEDVSKRFIILRHKGERLPVLRESRIEDTQRRDSIRHLLKDGNELILPCQTRFTDIGRQKEEIKKFHDAWREASQIYDGAVFLTLTSDPKSNPSLWDVNRHFAPAWNTYLSLIQKRLKIRRRDDLIKNCLSNIKRYNPARWEGIDEERRESESQIAERIEDLKSRTWWKDLPARDREKAILKIERSRNPYQGLNAAEKLEVRADLEVRILEDGSIKHETYRPVYIAVYEFMKNGLLHSHIVLFGTTYLDRIDQIREDWNRLGQGEMAHIYSLTKNPASGIWEWLGKKPNDAKNRQPVDYLGKYLIKGLYTPEGKALYWVFNKRFCSKSEILGDGWIDFSSRQESVWELLASVHENNIPLSLKIANRGSPYLRDWYSRHAGEFSGPPPLASG